MVVKSRSRIVILLLGLTIIVGALSFFRWAMVRKDLPVDQMELTQFRVLAYTTFIGYSGPGPALIAEFKKVCNCDVQITTAGDAGLLVERLKLSQQSHPFDLVVGLDQFSKEKALEVGPWKTISLDKKPEQIFDPLAIRSFDGRFIPFDYSPMTFIYREGEINPPKSLDDLLSARFAKSISLQDPTTSSPGLQFLNWIRQVYGDHALDYLKKLKPSVHSVSPSWALSYGLFKKDQSKLVFSYLTSLGFHWAVEKDLKYKAVNFSVGHPVQVEFVAVPEGCRQCELGEQFVKLMLTPESQALIAEKNYMFPSVKGATVPEIYKDLPNLKALPIAVESLDTDLWSKAFE